MLECYSLISDQQTSEITWAVTWINFPGQPLRVFLCCQSLKVFVFFSVVASLWFVWMKQVPWRWADELVEEQDGRLRGNVLTMLMSCDMILEKRVIFYICPVVTKYLSTLLSSYHPSGPPPGGLAFVAPSLLPLLIPSPLNPNPKSWFPALVST